MIDGQKFCAADAIETVGRLFSGAIVADAKMVEVSRNARQAMAEDPKPSSVGVCGPTGQGDANCVTPPQMTGLAEDACGVTSAPNCKSPEAHEGIGVLRWHAAF